MRNFFSIVILLIVSSFNARSIDCPIEDFNKVVAFCTEENEYGITYSAGTGDESIAYFEEEDEYRRRIHKAGCLDHIYAPKWYIMQIDKEGSLLMEISHSEQEDVDFACFGPYEGDSKIDVLKKICSSAPTSFSTDVDADKYRNFINKFQVKYPADCHFDAEYQPIYDSILNIDAFISSVRVGSTQSPKYYYVFEDECFVRALDKYYKFKDVKCKNVMELHNIPKELEDVSYGDLEITDGTSHIHWNDDLKGKKKGDITFGDNVFSDIRSGYSRGRYYHIGEIACDFWRGGYHVGHCDYANELFPQDLKDTICSHNDEIEDCVRSCMDSVKVLEEIFLNLKGRDPRYYDQTSNCFRADLDPFPDGKMVDCCYSVNSKEVCRIDNAKHGEWYLMLLSNYSQKGGDISFKKIGGEATTNCQIIVDPIVENVCEGEDIRFDVNNAPSGATFVWTGPNGFSSTLQSPVIHNASKEDEGTYAVQMKVGYMTSPLVELKVEVYEKYEVDTTVSIKAGESYEFAGEVLSDEGVYTHTFTTVNGCDSVVHLILNVGKLNVVTQSNGPLCEGERLVLSASCIPDKAKLQWTGPAGFSSQDSTVTIEGVTTQNGGDYQLNVIVGNLDVNLPPTHVDVYPQDNMDLFEYWNDSVFTFNNQVVNQPGLYKITLKNENGCDSVVTLHVQLAMDSMPVVPDPYFSPNGDGVKDRWFINGVDIVPTAVKIYDRFGKAIRAYDAYSNEEGWDGKDANGHDMPSADYWYVVSVAKTDRLFVGHVALVR